MSGFVFLFYKWILTPLAWLILQLARPFLRGKVREMIDDKNQGFQNVNSALPLSERPIWIHAASGEIEYARPLIRELKAKYPRVPVLVTYSSPSAKKILRQIPEIDVWGALPWEFTGSYRSFFSKWKPRLLLVARTDLWPIMAQSIAREKIPAYLFSATFAANSSRLRGLSKHLTSFSLDQLQGIFCVAESDKMNLQSLKIGTPVQVLGDSRFDQVLHRLRSPRPLRFAEHPAEFTFVMGSTWPQDEEVLLPSLPRLKALGCKFILAPHEIPESHLARLESSLAELGLSCVRYSKAAGWKQEDLLLLDQIGILAELYTWGNAAFVGGSFKKQVHSVMEPLAAGLPVLVGPHHLNNREAIELQNVSADQVQLVECVSSSADVLLAISKIREQSSQALKLEVKKVIEARTGATLRLLSEISKDIS